MVSGLKDGSDMKTATACAENCRKAKAGSYNGGKPPPGPKKEPAKLNGVPMIRESGMSK